MGSVRQYSWLMQPEGERARLFIGSSAEGLDVARNLQAELESIGVCEVTRWDQSVFEPSGYALDSLDAAAAKADFAVLIASPDDVTVSRDTEQQSVRDNVILEFGFFAGALGRERTYLLATTERDLKLPSDVFGLTRLPFRPRSDGNVRAAVNSAALAIQLRVHELGIRSRPAAQETTGRPGQDAVNYEIDLLSLNAESQGWRVRTNSVTTLRLVAPSGKQYAMRKSGPQDTRVQLRSFVRQLRSAGLRVNGALRSRVEDSPFY